MRRALGTAVGLSLALAAAAAGGCGLSLLVTLPYAHVGPGDRVPLYLTFRNAGPAPVAFDAAAPVTVETEVDGKTLALEVEEPPAENGDPPPGPVRLAPGERWVRRVTAPLDRRVFLPGDYVLKVACAPAGGPRLTAEVKMVVRYKVVFVY
jgi:hypothetical protein